MKYLNRDLLSFYSLFAVLGLTNHESFGSKIWYWGLVITIVCLILAIPYYLFRNWKTENRWRRTSLIVWWMLDVACLVVNFTIGFHFNLFQTQ